MDGTGGATEIEALRRSIGDIVALSTLSAIWAGASRCVIASGLAQVLHDTLRADFVHVELRGASGGSATHGSTPTANQHHLVSPIGINGEHGLIVTASGRDDF